MSFLSKYTDSIHLFTRAAFAFAFKKLFGTEVNKELLISFLNSLMDRPKVLVDAVFERFFEQADIANFTKQELYDYRESQKDYWDMFSVVETAENKGVAKGIAIGEERGIAIGEERERDKAYAQKLASARNLKSFGTLSNAQIAKALGVSENEVENA